MPRNVYHIDDLYESMDVIPSDAEKIVVKENSFDNAETLSVNNYPNLTSIVFEDNVFKNVNSVEINGDKLEEVVIGDNCFSKSESGVEGSRRLEDTGSIDLTLPHTERIRIGSKSALNVNTLVFNELLDSVEFELGSESMKNINLIRYSYGISADTINNIKSKIESNKGEGESIETETINTPSIIPTTATPTEAPTTQAPTTQAPTTQAPTTQAPTTQAPTTQAY